MLSLPQFLAIQNPSNRNLVIEHGALEDVFPKFHLPWPFGFTGVHSKTSWIDFLVGG